jgi:hypothetical protein
MRPAYIAGGPHQTIPRVVLFRGPAQSRRLASKSQNDGPGIENFVDVDVDVDVDEISEGLERHV